MAFRWRCLDADSAVLDGPVLDAGGAVLDGPDLTFADQQEAEDWLSATWPDLRSAGVHAVTLLDGDAEVYGPMGLDEQ